MLRLASGSTSLPLRAGPGACALAGPVRQQVGCRFAHSPPRRMQFARSLPSGPPRAAFHTSPQTYDTLLQTSLPNRAVTRVSGPDASKFLQGLVSNDLRDLGSAKLLYAGMLSPQGRLNQDVFLHADGEDVCVEHARDYADTLRKFFKRHKLRAKVKFALDTSATVHAAWIRKDAFDTKVAQVSQPRDPRCEPIGWRWLQFAGRDTSSPTDAPTVDSAHFHLHRILHAVPEGVEDYPAVPLEGNLDWMNGISYTKGCYVGQELVARTHFKGVVRKRSASVRLVGEDGEDTLFDVEKDQFLEPVHAENTASDDTTSDDTTSDDTTSHDPTSDDTPPESLDSNPSNILVDAAAKVKRPRPSGHLGTVIAVKNAHGAVRHIGYASIRLDLVLDGPGLLRIPDGPTYKAYVPEWMDPLVAQS